MLFEKLKMNVNIYQFIHLQLSEDRINQLAEDIKLAYENDGYVIELSYITCESNVQ